MQPGRVQGLGERQRWRKWLIGRGGRGGPYIGIESGIELCTQHRDICIRLRQPLFHTGRIRRMLTASILGADKKRAEKQDPDAAEGLLVLFFLSLPLP